MKSSVIGKLNIICSFLVQYFLRFQDKKNCILGRNMMSQNAACEQSAEYTSLVQNQVCLFEQNLSNVHTLIRNIEFLANTCIEKRFSTTFHIRSTSSAIDDFSGVAALRAHHFSIRLHVGSTSV